MTARLIGYWRSTQEQDWPDPGKFVDDTWPAATRAQVIRYLSEANVASVTAGASWCRFHCRGFGAYGLGSTELTDGRFVWPNGLAHYVEHHGVRLPDPFLESMKLAVEPFDPSAIGVDASWWKSQHGFGSSIATFLDSAKQGVLLTSSSGKKPSAALLGKLRTATELRDRSIPWLMSALQNTEQLVLARDVYEADIADLRHALKELGLETVFRNGV